MKNNNPLLHMGIFKYLIFILLTIIVNALSAYGSDDKCIQKFQYHPTTGQILKITKISSSKLPTTKDKNYTQHKTRFFINFKSKDAGEEIIIYKNTETSIKLQVKTHIHRPHRASWINEKLLHLDVWFNPHFGAYWIYDVEKEEIILNELENDGWTTYLQCEEFNKSKTNKPAKTN